MKYKTISTDYFRHNLKDVVMEILNTNQPIVLKYGSLGEILLSSKKAKKVSKKQLLVNKLQKKINSGKLAKTKYQGNQKLYQDYYQNKS